MVNQTNPLDSSWVDLGAGENQGTTEVKNRHHSGDSGIEGKEGSEGLDDKSQEILATRCDMSLEDLQLENEILANFPDGCNKSFTVESRDEDSYDIIPKGFTLEEITDTLNQAIKENNYEELNKVVQNIEDYEVQSIALDGESFKNFCSNQLNLDLQNNQHIYSNILSRYKFDQVELKCAYTVKELMLLAVAANNNLVERYRDVLFTAENLSLLPLLIGGQKYIEAFTDNPHGVDGIYRRLKDQAIQLGESSKVGFFSVIALRKEQELLKTVFVGYVLRDLEQVLKASKSDPLYGVLETASLMKNEEFIITLLDAFEENVNDPIRRDLLKKSFITLLETAISQEHVSIVECLCKQCTENKDPVIQEIYKEAFADNRVIEQLKKQIIKKIISGGTNGSRKEKAERIYDLIVQVAAHFGSTGFIMKVLDLIEIDHTSVPNTKYCKNRLKDSNSAKTFAKKNRQDLAVVNSKLFTNVDTQNLLHDSLVTILKSAQHTETVTNLYDRSWQYKARKQPAIQGIYNKAFKSVNKTFANQKISNQVNQIELIIAVALLTDNKPLIKRALDLVDRDIIDIQEKQEVLLRSLVSILTRSVACECFQTIQYICYGRYSKVSDPIVKEVYQKAFYRLMKSLDDKINNVEQGSIKHEWWIELKEHLIKNNKVLIKDAQLNESSDSMKVTEDNIQSSLETGNDVEEFVEINLADEIVSCVSKAITSGNCEELDKLNDEFLQNITSKRQQNILRNSLVASNMSAESIPAIRYLCEKHNTNIIDVLSKNGSEKINGDTALAILNCTAKLVREAVDAKDIKALSTYIGVVQANVAHVSPEEGLAVLKETEAIISDFISEQRKPFDETIYPAYGLITSTRFTSIPCNFVLNYTGYISLEDYKELRKLNESIASSIHFRLISRISSCSGKLTAVKRNSTSSQAVNKAGDEQPQNPGPNNQQENIVDNRKNIMDNRKASKEKPIGDNYEGGAVHSSNQNAKSIKERLSNAIWNINFKEVERLVEQGGKDITQLVLSEALQKANERIAGLKEGDKKQDQEDRLTQITGLLEKKLGNIGAEVAASSVGGEFSATTSDQEILVNVGNEEKQTPDQPTEQTTLQTGDEQEPGSEGGQQNPPRPSSLSLAGDSENGRGSGSPFSLVGTPSGTNGSDNEYVEVFPEDVVKEDPTLRSSGSPQGIQPEALPSASSNIGNVSTAEELAVVTANVEGGSGQFTGEDDQDSRPTPVPTPIPQPVPLAPVPTPVPEPMPAPVPEPTSAPLVTQDNDDSKQPSSTGKNDPASQNAKGSKWPVVAASVLAIAGIALGVAIAVHLEMLAVGIAVGACCLVAAAIMYYCAPKSSVEDNKVEEGLHPKKGSVSV